MKNVVLYKHVERDDTAAHHRIRRTFALTFAVLLAISCGFFSGTAQPAPTATVAAAPTATEIPTATATPVPPSLLAAAAIPCLSGPGDPFLPVVDLQAGEKAEIVGKSNGYWVVRTAAGSECWVPEQGVTTEGEVAAVPDVQAPPTPLPAAPAPPAYVQVIGAVCSTDRSKHPIKYINQFHLSWQDTSNNETGFRVYRDGDRVAELPADRTDVVDEIIAQNNRTHYYYVTAYNEVGETKSEPIALTCEGAGEGGGGGGGAPGPGPGPGPSGP